MTGPRLAADVLAQMPYLSLEDGYDLVATLMGDADMVALVRTHAGVEVRGLDVTSDLNRYRLVDAPADTQEADRG